MNWSGTSSPYPNSITYVPNIQLVYASVSVAPTTVALVNGVWTGSVTVPQWSNNMYLKLNDGAGHTALSNTFSVYNVPSTPSPAGGTANVPLGASLSWTSVQSCDAVDNAGTLGKLYTTSGDGGGNVYSVTASRLLTKIEAYLGITTSTDLRFFVYESTTSGGTYNKILDKDIPASGTGTKWFSSGAISVSLISGRYYYVGTCWQGAAAYSLNLANDSTSFGSVLGGGRIQSYPPPATTSNPGVSPYGAYYQRVTTGAETYDVYFDTASPPTHRIVQGIQQTTSNPGALANNTTYYWQVVAHNGLVAAPSPVWQFATVPAAPAATCNVATGAPANPLSTVFTFTNTAGWGSGGVDHYHYLWDQNPTDTLTGSEATWNVGTLPLTATAPGAWYLHLLSHNSGNGPGGTLDLGPYYCLDAPVLAAEPPYTPGTSNTITWAAVPGAASYYAECDNNSDFSSPEFNSGWITGTSQTFTGLTHGVTYYYHVKARLTIPVANGSWTQTSQSDFSADTLTNVSATAAPGDVVLAPAGSVDTVGSTASSNTMFQRWHRRRLFRDHDSDADQDRDVLQHFHLHRSAVLRL